MRKAITEASARGWTDPNTLTRRADRLTERYTEDYEERIWWKGRL